MEQIFKIALLVFALVVLPATWYYSKRTGKIPAANKPFEVRKESIKEEIITTIIILSGLLFMILLVDLGVI